MINLLKADLFRIVRDKLFLLLCIFCVVISLASSGLVALIYYSTGADNPAELSLILPILISPTGAFGLLLVIFLAILIGKDGSTLRNKIIVGKSRAQIYFTTIIVCEIIYVGFMLAFTLLTYVLAWGLVPAALGNVDIGKLISYIGIQLIGYVGIAAFLGFLSTAMPNMALSIVFGIIAVYMGYTAATLVDQLTLAYMQAARPEFIRGILLAFTPYGISAVSQTTLDWVFWLSYVGSVVVFSPLFICTGYAIFQKKNIK